MLKVSQTLHVFDNTRSYKQQLVHFLKQGVTCYILSIISKARLISATLPWSTNHKAPMPRKRYLKCSSITVNCFLLKAWKWVSLGKLLSTNGLILKALYHFIAQQVVHPHIYVKITKQDFGCLKEYLYFKYSKILIIL